MEHENQTQNVESKVSDKPSWERWVAGCFAGLTGVLLAFCLILVFNLRSPVVCGILISSGLVAGSLLGYRFTWLADFLLAILHGF